MCFLQIKKWVEGREDYEQIYERILPLGIRMTSLVKWVTCVVNMEKV